MELELDCSAQAHRPAEHRQTRDQEPGQRGRQQTAWRIRASVGWEVTSIVVPTDPAATVEELRQDVQRCSLQPLASCLPVALYIPIPLSSSQIIRVQSSHQFLEFGHSRSIMTVGRSYVLTCTGLQAYRLHWAYQAPWSGRWRGRADPRLGPAGWAGDAAGWGGPGARCAPRRRCGEDPCPMSHKRTPPCTTSTSTTPP